MPHHSRLHITSIDVCVHAGSQHRGIYDTHATTTAPHTDRLFAAVEGATALSTTRFHFMWTCVSADSPSSAPLLSPYFLFFHYWGSDFVTGFEEPDSALLPSSGSRWSSSILYSHSRRNSISFNSRELFGQINGELQGENNEDQCTKE